MKVIIRRARIKDFKILQRLDCQLFNSQYQAGFDDQLDFNWPFNKKGKRYYLKVLSEKKFCCFIAFNEKKEPLGYVSGGIKTDVTCRKIESAEMENILVLKKYRNKGIGRKLIEAFINWSRKKKLKRIYVSVYCKNKNAISFYKKNNFKMLDYGLELNIKK